MVHGHLCSQWGPRHRRRSGKRAEEPQCREEEATPAPAGSAMARSVGERVAASHLSTVQLPLCILAIPTQAAIPPGGSPLWVGARREGR